MPPEVHNTIREILPTAKASLELIDLDKKQGEKKVVMICSITDENIYMDIAVAALMVFEGKEYYVINRTLGDKMSLIPDSLNTLPAHDE